MDLQGPTIIEDLRSNNQIPGSLRDVDTSELLSFFVHGLHLVIGRFYSEYRSRESSQGSSSGPRASILDSGYLSNNDDVAQNCAESSSSSSGTSRAIIPSASAPGTSTQPDDIFRQWTSSAFFTSWSYAGLYDWQTTITIALDESQSDISLEWFDSDHWSMWMNEGYRNFHEALEQSTEPTQLLRAYETMNPGGPDAQHVWHKECDRYGSRIGTSPSLPVDSSS